MVRYTYGYSIHAGVRARDWCLAHEIVELVSVMGQNLSPRSNVSNL